MSKSNSYRFVKPLLHTHLDNPYAYALLTFLCHAAKNDTDESWHGHTSITYATGMRDRAIRSATRALTQMGLITCEVRGTVADKQTKRYVVHYEKLLAFERESKVARKGSFWVGGRKKRSTRELGETAPKRYSRPM